MSKFARSIDDIPVHLEEFTHDALGDVHAMWILSDEFFRQDLPVDVYRKLERSIQNYGGQSVVGKEGTVRVHPVGEERFIITMGLGGEDGWKRPDRLKAKSDLLEMLRTGVGNAYQQASGLGLPLRMTIDGNVSPMGWHNRTNVLEAITQAAVLCSYQGNRQYDPSDGKDSKVSAIDILVRREPTSVYTEGFRFASDAASSQNFARTIFEAPNNLMQPNDLLDCAESLASDIGVSIISRHNRSQFHSMPDAYRALAAIAEASPQAGMIQLSYDGNLGTMARIALVGKGLTFDSGGISLKTGKGMEEMNGDKGGAATVLGILRSVAKLALPINIDVYIPATENKPDSLAINPGSLIYMGNDASGKPFPPIEINNTDAEGRVVLATPIALAGMDRDIRAIIDFSTLTGAMVTAVGPFYNGIIANPRDSIAKDVSDAFIEQGDMAFQRFLLFPPTPQMEERIKGKYTGVSNVGPNNEGAAFDGYTFLNRFTSGKPFVHVDMAPSLSTTLPRSYYKSRFGTPPVIAAVYAMRDLAERRTLSQVIPTR